MYRAEEVVRIILEIALRPLQSPACVIEEQHALSGLYSREYTVAGILLAAPVEVVVGFQQPARPPVVECPFKLADNKVPAVGPPVGVGRLMDKSDIPQPLVVVGGPRASVDYIPHKGFHPVLIPIGGLDAVDPCLVQERENERRIFPMVPFHDFFQFRHYLHINGHACLAAQVTDVPVRHHPVGQPVHILEYHSTGVEDEQ